MGFHSKNFRSAYISNIKAEVSWLRTIQAIRSIFNC